MYNHLQPRKFDQFLNFLGVVYKRLPQWAHLADHSGSGGVITVPVPIFGSLPLDGFGQRPTCPLY